MGSISSDFPSSHVVFFPFMAKGHTIPLLHLVRLLRRRFRRLSVTIFATAAHRPFISQFLSDTSVSIIELSFPQDIPGLPAGVESTETLPSLSLFPEFCMATKLMQPDFEKELQALPPVNFLVSDGFLWWTLESASKFGIPRISFSGLSNFVGAISVAVMKDRLLAGVESDDELITVSSFPWVKVTRSDWDPVFLPEADPTSLHSRFLMASIQATINSYGSIVNSFYELEQVFCDYMKHGGARPKAWNLGPLCLAQTPKEAPHNKPTWLEWLDQKRSQGKPVLYVAFGSQADISAQQLNEIAIGLEESGVSFLWAKKGRESEVEEGFEERVKERGMVAREWVDQWEVLRHESVKGFLSHCGWNSVVESVSCGVPILAWPIMADQALNARMVVEELKAGLRAVERCGGSVKGFVEGKELQRLVRELMEGEKGKEVRKKAAEISEMAKKAMEEDGSSWRNLEELVQQMCNRQGQKNLQGTTGEGNTFNY
uniref:Glycosyltransferase n=1 Tax=Siraitia grosvenorii TaxID=190515 RepID=A0A346A6C2_SIRGR|nr:flavonoids UDP-glycosyltransferase [Siraitia grosvenorii]